MELQACIEALRAIGWWRFPAQLASYRKIVFLTDSKYLVEGFDSARVAWSRNRWLTRDGNPVSNASQWRELLQLSKRAGRPVEFRWVKGHKDSLFNKQADMMARASAEGAALRAPLDSRKVRRKTTSEKIQRGSVAMLGQEMTVRMVEELDQSQQRLVRFKYQVMTEDSPHSGKLDYIWAQRGTPMRAGHTYHVLVNQDTSAPRIVELLGEVKSPEEE